MQLYIQDGKYAQFKQSLGRLVKQYKVQSQSELIVTLVEKEAENSASESDADWIRTMCGATKTLDQKIYRAMKREISRSRTIKDV